MCLGAGVLCSSRYSIEYGPASCRVTKEETQERRKGKRKKKKEKQEEKKQPSVYSTPTPELIEREQDERERVSS